MLICFVKQKKTMFDMFPFVVFLCFFKTFVVIWTFDWTSKSLAKTNLLQNMCWGEQILPPPPHWNVLLFTLQIPGKAQFVAKHVLGWADSAPAFILYFLLLKINSHLVISVWSELFRNRPYKEGLPCWSQRYGRWLFSATHNYMSSSFAANRAVAGFFFDNPPFLLPNSSFWIFTIVLSIILNKRCKGSL